jgi:kynurenine formamidase
MSLPEPPLFGRRPHSHEIWRKSGTGDAESFQDDILTGWNTQAASQWDGFRHVERSGYGYYGGLPNGEHGVHFWSEHGIVGRAVVADVARWRETVGRPLRFAEPDPIEPSDVIECLRDQGVTVRAGDILLVRTGWLGWYNQLDDARRLAIGEVNGLANPGLRNVEEMATLLWDLHIAAIAADNPALEVWPLGAAADAEINRPSSSSQAASSEPMLLHVRLLPMLGIPVGELFVLDALAADCAQDGIYECFFTSAPLNLPHGAASPPNAIAIK